MHAPAPGSPERAYHVNPNVAVDDAVFAERWPIATGFDRRNVGQSVRWWIHCETGLRRALSLERQRIGSKHLKSQAPVLDATREGWTWMRALGDRAALERQCHGGRRRGAATLGRSRYRGAGLCSADRDLLTVDDPPPPVAQAGGDGERVAPARQRARCEQRRVQLPVGEARVACGVDLAGA